MTASSTKLSLANIRGPLGIDLSIQEHTSLHIRPLRLCRSSHAHTYSPRTDHRNYAFGRTLPSTLISHILEWIVFVHIMRRHSSCFCHIEVSDARFLGTTKISRSFRLRSMSRPMISFADFHKSSMTTVARHRLRHFAPPYVYPLLLNACHTPLSHIRIPSLLPSLSTPAQILESFTHAAAIMLFNPTTLYAAPHLFILQSTRLYPYPHQSRLTVVLRFS